jgi:hypothetical protein
MPLIGGGGAGNTAGGNPVGTGTGLNYIGDHAYAYSGIAASSPTPATVLNFSTANQYIVAQFQPIRTADSTDNVQWLINFDGQTVSGVVVNSSRDSTPYEPLTLIIPAYTRVEVIQDNVSGGTDDCGFVVTGRIYYA